MFCKSQRLKTNSGTENAGSQGDWHKVRSPSQTIQCQEDDIEDFILHYGSNGKFSKIVRRDVTKSLRQYIKMIISLQMENSTEGAMSRST